MEKITKENLVEKIAVLRDENERLILQDQIKRKEFAKAFSWYIEKQSYGYSSKEKELEIPSWEQIFIKVGKLLAVRNFYDFEGNVSELEVKLEELEKRLLKTFNPNL